MGRAESDPSIMSERQLSKYEDNKLIFDKDPYNCDYTQKDDSNSMRSFGIRPEGSIHTTNNPSNHDEPEDDQSKTLSFHTCHTNSDARKIPVKKKPKLLANQSIGSFQASSS